MKKPPASAAEVLRLLAGKSAAASALSFAARAALLASVDDRPAVLAFLQLGDSLAPPALPAACNLTRSAALAVAYATSHPEPDTAFRHLLAATVAACGRDWRPAAKLLAGVVLAPGGAAASALRYGDGDDAIDGVRSALLAALWDAMAAGGWPRLQPHAHAFLAVLAGHRALAGPKVTATMLRLALVDVGDEVATRVIGSFAAQIPGAPPPSVGQPCTRLQRSLYIWDAGRTAEGAA